MKIKKLLTKPNFQAFLLINITWLIFFYKFLSPNYWVWESDAILKHYPTREYIYNALVVEHRFPFYTDRVFTGFPVYADVESQYINPANILSIILFGPYWSVKILMYLSYLLGSYCLWLFLKKKGIPVTGFFVANLAYYFSFYHLNHLIHFNIIFPSLLLPVSLLLTDLYQENYEIINKRNKWLLLNAALFAFIFTWGHPQTQIMMFVVLGLYNFIVISKKIGLLKTLYYLISVVVLSITMSLPLLLPASQLFIHSYRTEGTGVSEGYFNLPLFANTVVPFLYGKSSEFMGLQGVGSSYSYTETYVYLGISVVTAAGLSFLLRKRDGLMTFSVILVILYIFLASLKYIPFRDDLPVVNLFRFWGRFVSIAGLALGIMAARLFSLKREDIKIYDPFKVGAVILMILYFIYIYFVGHNNTLYERAAVYLDLKWSMHTVWLICGLGTLLIPTALYFKKYSKYILIFSCLFFLVDLRFYGQDVLSHRVHKIEKKSVNRKLEGLDGKRVIDLSENTLAMQYLNTNYSTLFGYSNFYNGDYKKLIGNYGYHNKLFNAEGRETLDDILINKIGVDAMVLENGEIIRTENLDIYDNRSYEIIQNEEEFKKIRIVEASEKIDTFVRCYPDWQVFYDGKKGSYNCGDDGLFIILDPEQNTKIAELKYIPSTFNKAVLLSIILTAAGIFPLYWGSKI